MKERPLQALLVGAALLGWAAWGEPGLWALALCYLAAWVLFNWGGWSALALPELPSRAVRVGVIALVLAAPVLALASQARLLAVREGVYGLSEQLGDRLRLEATPSIAPPVVQADRPQTFYVHAPGEGAVTVRIGDAEQEATSLGEGLFRVDYDPRQHGAPRTTAGILVDGSRVELAMQVVAAIAQPRWFDASSDRGLAITTSEETDEIAVVRRDGSLRRFEVGDGPVDAVLFGDRGAVVAHRYDDDLRSLDLETGALVALARVGFFQGRLAVSPHRSTVAVCLDGGQRGVALVSPSRQGSEPATVEHVPTSFSPDWPVFVDEETVLVAGLETRSIHRIFRRDGAWVTDEATLPLGRPVVAAARSVHEGAWHVATTAYRADGGMPTGNHFVEDQILTIDATRFALVDRMPTARGGEAQDDPGTVESGGSPMGFDVLDDGAVLVAFAGTEEIARVRPGARSHEVMFDLGATGARVWAPHGVAALGEGRIAVASPSAGTIGVFGEGGEVVAVHSLLRGDETSEAPQTLVRRRGARTFYEATRSGVSCQSCHRHGGHDYALHDLTPIGLAPLAPKPTLSTLGIAGTAPYLRDASFPSVAALHEVSVFRYRGFTREEPNRAEELEAYVAALPLPLAPRALEGSDLELDRRGVRAFVRASCAACHRFPAFTNLGQHPVRTLFPTFGKSLRPDDVVDTPSLFALRSSPPYLYDGRAATIRSVVEDHNPDNRHGDTARLTPEERADLVRFLESL